MSPAPGAGDPDSAMSEECAECGAYFASAEQLLSHRSAAHRGGDARATLAMNPESRTPGLVCALCGHRFGTPQELARHNLAPHPAL